MTRFNKNPLSGKYGKFGGRFVPETLVPALEELEKSYDKISSDKDFQKELKDYLSNYAGRPSPLYYAKNLSKKTGWCQNIPKERGPSSRWST